MKNLVSVIVILFFSIQSFGCSCKSLDGIMDEDYDRAQLIVKGKIKKIEIKGYKQVIHVKVIIDYKTALQDSVVEITSYTSGDACGMSFKEGTTWLLFAYNKGGVFFTNMCTRSQRIQTKETGGYKRKFLKEDLTFLEEKLKTK
tara:strand:+ start:1519 stop:1950 length:432 start_codon:yes stop_codon:yes gene_type:complete